MITNLTLQRICSNCQGSINSQEELIRHNQLCKNIKKINGTNPNKSPAAIGYIINNFHKLSPKRFLSCVYDSTIISEVNKSEYPNVCSNYECIYEYKQKCKKVFKCSHQCLGLEGDDCIMFECLVTDCKQYNKIFDQNNNSTCSICMDSLQNFSLIRLPCNHCIHQRCLAKRLKMKWNTKDISFNYIKCPVCNNDIKDTIKTCTFNNEVLSLFEEAIALYNKIKSVLKEQKLNENDKNEENMYSLEENLERFSFYICEKCDNPFYAGLRNCREDDANLEKDIKDEIIYKEDKILCLDCYDYKKIKGVTNCELHGRTHIQFKCKFCCNVSSHFCFGTTHFCEDCHIRQLKGDYLTKTDVNELPKCKGVCGILNVEHPLNGEEFGLYCLLCLK